MLNGTFVTLRAAEDRDIEVLISGRNDLEIESASQATMPRPLTAAVLRQRFDAGMSAISSGSPDDIEFVVARTDDPTRRAIGIAGLYDVDPYNGLAEVGVSIVDRAAHGEGLGLDCSLMLARYGFLNLRLNKVYACVKSTSAAALVGCRRLGLTEDGILPEHRWIDGRHVDLHIFGLLRSNWDPELENWRQR